MTALLTTLVLLIVGLAGLFPAIRIAPAKLLIGPVALLIGILETSVAGVVTALVDVPLLGGLLIAAIAANAGALLLPQRAGTDFPLRIPPLAGLVLVAVVAYQLRGAMHPNYGYDARTVWILHARYLWAGHQSFAYYVSLPHNQSPISLPEYPDLGPSAMASVWRLGGFGVDYRVAQLTIVACNATAVLLLGGAVAALPVGTSRFLRTSATAAAAIVVFLALGDASAVSVNGYMDLLWAAAATAAVGYGLIAPMDGRLRNLALVLLVIAAEVKADAVPVSAAAAVTICARYVGFNRLGALGRTRAQIFPLALSAIGIDIWSLVTRRYGVTNYILASGRVGKLLHLDSSVTDRIQPVASAVRPFLSTWPLTAVAGVLGAVVLYRGLGTGRSGPWLVWLVAAADLLAVAFGYLVNPIGLDFELATSITRVALFLRDISYLELACWVPLLAEIAVRGSRRPAATPDRSAQPTTAAA